MLKILLEENITTNEKQPVCSRKQVENALFVFSEAPRLI
ncbi:hypothetical protein BQ1740_2373 [Bacillus subtilis]|nr:hypothetical protein BQ1740_2373 [Bacillus subtilis]